jgi:hypothetical protein
MCACVLVVVCWCTAICVLVCVGVRARVDVLASCVSMCSVCACMIVCDTV